MRFVSSLDCLFKESIRWILVSMLLHAIHVHVLRIEVVYEYGVLLLVVIPAAAATSLEAYVDKREQNGAQKPDHEEQCGIAKCRTARHLLHRNL